MPHLQMLLMWWMPLTLFALHRYLDRRRPVDLVLAGVAWLMNGLTSGYFLVYFGVLIGFWALWFLRTRRDWILVPATLIVATLPLVPLLVGYSQIQSRYGMSRSPHEVTGFSADLTAVWASAPDVIADLWTSNPAPEGELYPGLTIFLVAAAGAAIAWRTHRSGQWPRVRRALCAAALLIGGVALILAVLGTWTTNLPGADVSLSRPGKLFRAALLVLIVVVWWDRRALGLWQRRSAQFFYGAGAVVMLLFALGPVARVFGSPFLYQTPYSWLMELPGGDALRVPARFGVLFAMCLGQAAAIGFTRFSLSGATKVVAAVLTAAIYVEGWVPRFPVQPVPPMFDLEQMRPELPLLELPVSEHFSDSEAMLRATRHRHPLVHGTSGYAPPYYEGMVARLQALDPVMIEALQAYGPFLVFVNHATDAKQRTRSFFDEYPGAAVVGRSQVGSLYELPRKLPAVPTDPSAGELPIASLEGLRERQDNCWHDRPKSIDTLGHWRTAAAGRSSDGRVRASFHHLSPRIAARHLGPGFSTGTPRDRGHWQRARDDGLGWCDRRPGAARARERSRSRPRCSSPCRPARRRIASSSLSPPGTRRFTGPLPS